MARGEGIECELQEGRDCLVRWVVTMRRTYRVRSRSSVNLELVNKDQHMRKE